MGLNNSLRFAIIALTSMSCLNSNAQGVSTFEDYNKSLLDYGVSWKTSPVTYYPSIYTGFAPKTETANLIHLRLSRGNVARFTAILDEQTILTYPFQLKSREDLFKLAIEKKFIKPVQGDQLNGFLSVVSSPTYSINSLIQKINTNLISRENYYSQSLSLLKKLNPGRIFDIKINLAQAFTNWKNTYKDKFSAHLTSSDSLTLFLNKNSKEAIMAANHLLEGRVNVTMLSANQIKLMSQALTTSDQLLFLKLSADLLNDLTQNRFLFSVVENGQKRKALVCESVAHCTLLYSEFTAIYPVGSAKANARDHDGSSVAYIREEGAMNFKNMLGSEVDQIRPEGYYGWAPKMNYTSTHNGFHNPAVRTRRSERYASLFDKMKIPSQHDHYWVLSRGPVSHGCTRLSAGHILELRHLLPSLNSEVLKVVYHGNYSPDFDLFDVSGSGQLQVMGVKYFIAYDLLGDTGAGYREANGLSTGSFNRLEFYKKLYGVNKFKVINDQVIFTNPYITHFVGPLKSAGLDRAKPVSEKILGEYSLYEQDYEKDKAQFVDLPSNGISSLTQGRNNLANKTVQNLLLFGRVAACGPFSSEFKNCFESEYKNKLLTLN